MTNDIVKRLREGAYCDSLDDKLMKEAADEIVALREEVILLREASKFKEIAVISTGRHP